MIILIFQRILYAVLQAQEASCMDDLQFDSTLFVLEEHRFQVNEYGVPIKDDFVVAVGTTFDIPAVCSPPPSRQAKPNKDLVLNH